MELWKGHRGTPLCGKDWAEAHKEDDIPEGTLTIQKGTSRVTLTQRASPTARKAVLRNLGLKPRKPKR